MDYPTITPQALLRLLRKRRDEATAVLLYTGEDHEDFQEARLTLTQVWQAEKSLREGVSPEDVLREMES